MLKRIFMTVLMVMFTSLVMAAGGTMAQNPRLTSADPKIKILLSQGVSSAEVGIKGSYRVYNPADGSLLSSGIFGKAYPITPTSDGLKWGEEFPSVYQIVIVPSKADTPLLINGQPYGGVLYVYQVKDEINLVNQIRIEDYLHSVLAATPEDESLHLETVATMAIAARTDAYFQALQHDDAFYHVKASQVGYKGLNTPYYPKLAQAIDMTKNLVIKSPSSKNQGLFHATWTEHCAGKTAATHVIFRKDLSAPKQGVKSAIAATDREGSAWTFLVKKQELAKMLGMKQLNNVSLYTDPASGKVYGVKVQGDSETKDIDFLTFQQKVGTTRIDSSDFTLNTEGDILSFTGFGEGHGVGICIYSAEQMAENGADAVQIISKFYPGVEVIAMTTLSPKEAEGETLNAVKTKSKQTPSLRRR